jgi:hypothetical protein
MTVIVQGHGNRMDDQTTFVPVGTTLRFYSGFDVDLSQNVALIAIANGAQAPAQDPIIGAGKKTDVANYQFETMEDQFIGRWLAIGGESRIPIYFVGNSEIKNKDRLCNRPEVCDGTHTCDGVLGVLKEEKDIVILACRGYVGNKNRPIEQTYGTDADNPLQRLDLDVAAFVDKILALAKSDPTAAEQGVDELSQEHMAMLINRKDFQAWQRARHLKNFAQAGDFKQMIGHLKANEKDLDATSGDRSTTIMKWLEDIPSYGAAVDQAVTTNLRAVLRELTSISDQERNVDSALKLRANIATAITAMREADFEASKNWKPDDSLLAETTERNAANVKAMSADDKETIVAGRGLVLIGRGHDDRLYSYLSGRSDDGNVQVKGTAFKILEVEGLHDGEFHELIQSAVAAFSRMKVTFIPGEGTTATDKNADGIDLDGNDRQSIDLDDNDRDSIDLDDEGNESSDSEESF